MKRKGQKEEIPCLVKMIVRSGLYY